MSERINSIRGKDGSLTMSPELADVLIRWLDVCERSEDTLKGYIAHLTALVNSATDERLPRE